MKKSARVSLTLVAAVACAARAQGPDPCAAGTFSANACHSAIKSHGYWSGCTWVPQQYQKYPYYYNFFRAYASTGGLVAAAPEDTCRGLLHGGFGAIGARRHAGS